jgi:hypothetical protein
MTIVSRPAFHLVFDSGVASANRVSKDVDSVVAVHSSIP